LFLDADIYNEVWSQVAADRYTDCTVTVTIGPITFQSDNWGLGREGAQEAFHRRGVYTFVREGEP
jgi:hypothetical protein